MKFQGCITALVTPFAPDGAVNFQKLGELLEFQIAGGADAVLVWAWNCIHTERFAHDVVTSDYGQDLAGLIGKPYGDEVRQSEAVRKLREALLINPYITSVDQVSAAFEGSWLHVSFSIHTIYGEVSVRDAAISI